jgi:ribosomal protein S18 acetylase RimI-like enzyme
MPDGVPACFVGAALAAGRPDTAAAEAPVPGAVETLPAAFVAVVRACVWQAVTAHSSANTPANGLPERAAAFTGVPAEGRPSIASSYGDHPARPTFVPPFPDRHYTRARCRGVPPRELAGKQHSPAGRRARGGTMTLALDCAIPRLEPADALAYRDLRLLGLAESPTAFGSSVEEESRLALEDFARRLPSEPGDDAVLTLGAWQGDRLVGLATFRRETRVKSRHRGGIYGVFVHPEARGQGLARALMETLLAEVRGYAGLRQLHLAVVCGNEAARRLYRGLGFVAYGVEPDALCIDGRFVDEELMVLQLI